MPPKRTSNPSSATSAAPSTPPTPPSPTTPSSAQSKEPEDSVSHTPSPLKRKLLELTDKHQKRTNSRVRGVHFTRFILDDDDSLIAFCVEGKSQNLVFRDAWIIILSNHQGETYRPSVKDILMGRSVTPTPRARFHTSANVTTMFDHAKPAPAALQRTAWWYFAGITVSGGDVELSRAYDQVFELITALPFADFPVSEDAPERVSEELLGDMALLWPPLGEQA